MIKYVILGMKRSGHHALAYWIANNVPGKTIMYNDCNSLYRKGDYFNAFQHGVKQIQEINSGKLNCEIYNIEDFDIDWLNHIDFENFKELQGSPYHIILVLRDPFNWIASSLKTNGYSAKFIGRRIKLWEKQARFCLEANTKKLILPVSYNLWFSNNFYKNALSIILKLESYNNGINMVSPRGGGSSFDKLQFQNKAQEMDVLNRWRHYSKDPNYWGLITDEIGKLSEEATHFPNLKEKYDAKGCSKTKDQLLPECIK